MTLVTPASRIASPRFSSSSAPLLVGVDQGLTETTDVGPHHDIVVCPGPVGITEFDSAMQGLVECFHRHMALVRRGVPGAEVTNGVATIGRLNVDVDTDCHAFSVQR